MRILIAGFLMSAAIAFPSERRIAMLESQLKAEPGKAHLRVALAQAFLHRMRETTDYGYMDRAGKLLDGVLKADAENYEALKVSVELDLFRHDFARVIENSKKLAARDSKDAVNWATLGDAYMETGQYDDAADAYQKMANLSAGLMSLNRIGWYRFVTGDTPGAIEYMSRAVRAGRPKQEFTAWCLVELGNLYFKSGRIGDADASYKMALSHFDRSHTANAGLGNVAAAQGKTTEAIEHYSKAQSLAPLVEYAGALADLYDVSGNAAEREHQLQLVDVMAKMEAASGQKANRGLALIYANHERNLKEAVGIAEADLAIRKDVYTWDAYSWALLRAGRIEEAAKASKQALSAGTQEPMFFYHAGRIALAQGEESSALELLRKAEALNAHFDIRESRTVAQLIAKLERCDVQPLPASRPADR